MAKIEIVEVLPDEGGRWEKFIPGNRKWVHGFKFSDGTVWDSVNGWRSGTDLDVRLATLELTKPKAADIMDGMWFLNMAQWLLDVAKEVRGKK